MMTIEADREAPVRECPLCPPWVECAHFGDQVVWLASCESEVWLRHQPGCLAGGKHKSYGIEVCGPGSLVEHPDWCWPRYLGTVAEYLDFSTEAEARAEFDRRVAMMLEAE